MTENFEVGFTLISPKFVIFVGATTVQLPILPSLDLSSSYAVFISLQQGTSHWVETVEV